MRTRTDRNVGFLLARRAALVLDEGEDLDVSRRPVADPLLPEPALVAAVVRGEARFSVWCLANWRALAGRRLELERLERTFDRNEWAALAFVLTDRLLSDVFPTLSARAQGASRVTRQLSPERS